MKRQLSIFAAGGVLLCSVSIAQHEHPTNPASIDTKLQQVAAVHGAAGVFAVAGYRMGERALRELDAERGSFALDVTHRTPMQVQYSCVADGWQAATGVSAGKLNLHIEETQVENTETIIRNKKTGQTLVFRLRKEFLTKYLNVPEQKQKQAGREVALLPDDQIFTVSTTAQ